MTEPTSPQLEDGFVRIANELFDVIFDRPFTHRQHKVVFAIIRKTYGYGKKEDDISASQIGNFCRLSREHVTRTLNELEKMNVINKRPGAYGSVVGINKNYSTWRFEDKKSAQVDSAKSAHGCQKSTSAKSAQGVPNRTDDSAKSAQVDSAKSAHTKDNLPKDNLQKKTTSAAIEKISIDAGGEWRHIPDHLMATWKKAYPAIDVQAELAKAAAWIISNPRNRKKNYSRYLTNWLSREQDRAPRVRPGSSVDDGWWRRAGFSSSYEAENAGCNQWISDQWRNGKRLGVTA